MFFSVSVVFTARLCECECVYCSVCEQIESLLQRNHSPRKFAAEHEYRLQQGFLTSSTQEVLIIIIVITACAVATSCCISDVSSQWEGAIFDPP